MLDLGCGKGGGIAFLAKYYLPFHAVGMDISEQSLKACNDKYGDIDNLSFLHVIRIRSSE